MKLTRLLIAGAGLAPFGVDALRVEKRDSPAILRIPLQKKIPEVLARSLKERRDGTVETPDINYQRSLLYVVELLIDSANSSSTYEYIDSNFQVAYAGGDGATGDWCSDMVSIGGAILQFAEFGIQYQSTIQEGILGVSYPEIEGRNTFSGEPIYDNFPVLLVKQGYIASRAFSLWTNDDRSDSGTLLFGGIDTSKFSGELVTIDLVASGFDGFPGVVDFTLVLNGVTGTDGSGNPVSFVGGSTPVNVLMDSGTTFTALPSPLVASIWSFVGATAYDNDPNLAYILCSVGDTTETINLAFSGITIHVPLSQLVVFPDADNVWCVFGIAKTASDPIIGDTVLTSMYLVYDLDNNQISMASTVFNPTAPENILQIMAGPGGVPHPIVVSSSISSSSSSSSLVSSSSLPSSSSSSSSSILSSTSSSVSSSSSSLPSSSSSSSAASSSSNSLPSSSSSSILSSTTSSVLSSSVSISSSIPQTSSTMLTSTTKPTASVTSVIPLKYNKDNCFRAIQKASATAFCSAYQGGIPAPIPTAIANGCQTLASRISRGCACYAPFTAGVALTSTSASTSTSSTVYFMSTRSSTTTSSVARSTSATASPITTPQKLKCSMNNCLRAVSKLSATDFCSAYVTGAPIAVPSAIQKGCATSASRVSSACNCLISSV